MSGFGYKMVLPDGLEIAACAARVAHYLSQPGIQHRPRGAVFSYEEIKWTARRLMDRNGWSDMQATYFMSVAFCERMLGESIVIDQPLFVKHPGCPHVNPDDNLAAYVVAPGVDPELWAMSVALELL